MSAAKLRETLQKPRLRGLGRPGREVIALAARRRVSAGAKKAPRFRLAEAGEVRGFEIGRGAVGLLDQLFLRAGSSFGGRPNRTWMAERRRNSTAL